MEQLNAFDLDTLFLSLESLTDWILSGISTFFDSLVGIINSVTTSIQSFVTILTSFSTYSNMAFNSIPVFFINMFVFSLVMVVVFIFVKEVL